jgi:hypothetical protein
VTYSLVVLGVGPDADDRERWRYRSVKVPHEQRAAGKLVGEITATGAEVLDVADRAGEGPGAVPKVLPPSPPQLRGKVMEKRY